MPAMAETGMHMVVFNVVTVFLFLIPIALVSAELATGWPQNGVFHWVEAAFGSRTGFIAVWLQWIQSIFGITSILAYVGGSLAYVFAPDLGNNPIFITTTILVIYWSATFLNFKGAKRSGTISSVALLLGVLLPSVLLIIGALSYALSDNVIHLDFSWSYTNYIPSFADSNGWVLFLSFVFGFVGIEVSATHASEVDNPQRNFPIALFSAALLGFVVTLLGGMAIGILIPQTEINSINGATQAFAVLLEHFDLVWLTPLIAFLIAMGAAGQVSTWVIGPIKGLWSAGCEGHLPAKLLKTNRYDVPTSLLIVQAVFISTIGLLFLLVNDINSLFLLLTSVAIILYSIMYILMFSAAIRLRYTHPEVPRAYKVPGGNFGMWIVALTGGLCAVACLIIGFIPPTPNPMSFISYETILIGSCFISLVIAFLILAMRRNTHRIPPSNHLKTH